MQRFLIIRCWSLCSPCDVQRQVGPTSMLTPSGNVLDHPNTAPMEPDQVAVTARQRDSRSNTLEGGFGDAVFTIGYLLGVVKVYEKLNSPLELPTAEIPASKNYASGCSSPLGGGSYDLWREGTAPVKQNFCLPRCLWQDQALVNYTLALGKFHYFYLLEESRCNAIFSMWILLFNCCMVTRSSTRGTCEKTQSPPGGQCWYYTTGPFRSVTCRRPYEKEEPFHVKTFPICI